MKTLVGWTRLSAAGDKCRARWRHDSSGWRVEHCGHPTANWPYVISGPEGFAGLVSFNGLGFQTLAIACAVLERCARGELRVTTKGGCPRILVTAGGEDLTEGMLKPRERRPR